MLTFLRQIFSCFTATLLLLTASLPALACIWDSDTLAMEAKDLPDTPYIIAGRFRRNPPLYYEMRRARSMKLLEREPLSFVSYDNIGAACDRLGRHKEAVAWMHKKRAAMEDKANVGLTDKLSRREHLYRYHANIGTFLMHGWLADGAKPEEIGTAKTARAHIAAALKINPDAHFGREKYQLMAMQWAIAVRQGKEARPFGTYLVEKIESRSAAGRKAELAEAVRGLSGLVALGNAWESIDVYGALFATLSVQRHSAVASLALQRCAELRRDGKKSLLPSLNAARSEGEFTNILRRSVMHSESWKASPKQYRRLRDEADVWQASRRAFMTRRLKQRLHPDTDGAFWLGYQDRGRPSLVENWFDEIAVRAFGRFSFLAYFLLGAVVVVGWAFALLRVFNGWKRRIGRRKKH